MSVPVCSMNTTSDIYLLNQDLINAANIAIQLNIEYNSFHYLTSNITSLRNFQLYNLPLIEQYIHFHGTTHMSYCSHVTNFQSNFYLRNILQTYVQPFVIFFTIITNCLISIVLTYPTMRNSTNIILLGIAICDLLTVLLPLPVYLCFLTSNLFIEHLTVLKGYSVFYLTTILPTVCHTSSIWLTVLLALQRFIYVQYPLKANHICLCQWRSVQILISLTVIAGLLLQLPHMIVTHFVNSLEYCFTSFITSNITSTTSSTSSSSSKTSSSSLTTPVTLSSLNTEYFINSEYISYRFNTSKQNNNNFDYITFQRINLMKCTPMSQTTFFTLLLIRVLIVNLIPCIMLTILTGLLIMALRRFIQNRQKLLKIKNENRSILLNKNTTNSYMKKKHKENLKLEEISIIDNELKLSVNTPLDTTKITNTLTSTNNSLRKMPTRNNSTDTDSTSKMMLVILGIFLFTEIPTTVCLCIYAFITLLDIHPPSAFYEIVEICNFLVILSYPANFFVYLAMSRQFKNTFWEIFYQLRRNRHDSTVNRSNIKMK
ncbi:Sex peptide receptor [Schistosoma japonicum]|uniref:Sex peptide receptor n=1 Tax=Schistosoma japonicum TaxID=6182 RepID=A0A4Z2D937_SCHJA|nr:Sex peptide receptor [Schistosoma japonicum]TNN13017.1 Sex peptide receptor [Schistosoma japonicum]